MDTVPELDPVLHQPVRTRIAMLLAARGEVSFSELKKALVLSNGNLDAHLKKLAAAGYLHTRFVLDSRPYTAYSLSRSGQAVFRKYASALQALLKQL